MRRTNDANHYTTPPSKDTCCAVDITSDVALVAVRRVWSRRVEQRWRRVNVSFPPFFRQITVDT